MSDTCTTGLLHVLAAEATAIINGHYTQLDDLLAQKLALFDKLPRTAANSHDLQKIADLLLQNQRLLAAAVKGISAARDRIETLGKVRSGLQVYDETGQFATPFVRRPDVIRQA